MHLAGWCYTLTALSFSSFSLSVIISVVLSIVMSVAANNCFSFLLFMFVFHKAEVWPCYAGIFLQFQLLWQFLIMHYPCTVSAFVPPYRSPVFYYALLMYSLWICSTLPFSCLLLCITLVQSLDLFHPSVLLSLTVHYSCTVSAFVPPFRSPVSYYALLLYSLCICSTIPFSCLLLCITPVQSLDLFHTTVLLSLTMRYSCTVFAFVPPYCSPVSYYALLMYILCICSTLLFSCLLLCITPVQSLHLFHPSVLLSLTMRYSCTVFAFVPPFRSPVSYYALLLYSLWICSTIPFSCLLLCVTPVQSLHLFHPTVSYYALLLYSLCICSTLPFSCLLLCVTPVQSLHLFHHSVLLSLTMHYSCTVFGFVPPFRSPVSYYALLMYILCICFTLLFSYLLLCITPVQSLHLFHPTVLLSLTMHYSCTVFAFVPSFRSPISYYALLMYILCICSTLMFSCLLLCITPVQSLHLFHPTVLLSLTMHYSCTVFAFVPPYCSPGSYYALLLYSLCICSTLMFSCLLLCTTPVQSLHLFHPTVLLSLTMRYSCTVFGFVPPYCSPVSYYALILYSLCICSTLLFSWLLLCITPVQSLHLFHPTVLLALTMHYFCTVSAFVLLCSYPGSYCSLSNSISSSSLSPYSQILKCVHIG